MTAFSAVPAYNSQEVNTLYLNTFYMNIGLNIWKRMFLRYVWSSYLHVHYMYLSKNLSIYFLENSRLRRVFAILHIYPESFVEINSV